MLGLRLVSRTVVRTGSRSMSSLAAVDQVMAAPKIEAGQRAFQENGHLHGADNPVRLQVCYFFAHCTRTCLSPPPLPHARPHTIQTYLKMGNGWSSFGFCVGVGALSIGMTWNGLSHMRNGTNTFD